MNIKKGYPMFRVSIFLTIIFFGVTFVFTKPSMNASSGCSGGGCHTFNQGILSVSVISDTEVEVLLTGVSSGQDVAGELLDSNGKIVDVVNATKSNPFVLTAPSAGKYLVNAGFKRPDRQWDSTSVAFGVTRLGNNLNTIPGNFIVYPNYPNPFNPSTSISFYVPTSQYVEITIYDVLGQKMETLLSEKVSQGRHTYRWQADNVNSGVYFYKVSAGQQIKINKMILTR